MDPSRAALAALVALVICLVPAGTAAAARPANPCLDVRLRAALRCPDLVMKKPFGLYVDRASWPGHALLRAGNSIDNVGTGPAELHGRRTSRFFMRARQRIYRRGGGRFGISTGARLFFKYVPGQRRFWKFRDAARFALWRLDARGVAVRRVRFGPKVSYCLRDLTRTRPRRPYSPRRRIYPACNTSFAMRRVTLGTSVGWSDIYPPSYPQQWIDVTGLRGCFSYRHTADPRNGIYESDESNNTAAITVRLPYRPGRQRCRTAGGSPRPAPPPPAPPGY